MACFDELDRTLIASFQLYERYVVRGMSWTRP